MKSNPERVFALIIGINEYRSDKHMNLRGCVNDARAMGLFLSSLQVPEANSCTLINEDATRESILSRFQMHLIRNRQIEKGDVIIFFYAGHGSRVEAPKDWETSDGKIETICPHDEGTRDKDGKEIFGIPSITINELFRTLAAEKGNNITAIFDSCHSGGVVHATTTKSGEKLVARCTEGSPIKDPELDADVRGRRFADVKISEEFVYDSMSSHILLAACKRGEQAYEATSSSGESCGTFTNALIATLYSAPLDRMTYVELIRCLPALPRDQIPQCGGTNTNRCLFYAIVSPAEEYKISFPVKQRSAIAKGTEGGGEVEAGLIHGVSTGTKFYIKSTDYAPVSSNAEGGDESEYEVEAGLIHGVSTGTEFYIQSTDYAGSVSKYLGVLVAKTVHAQSSILVRRGDDPNFEVPPEGARAIVSNWKNDASILKVFVHPEDPTLDGFLHSKDETLEEKLRKRCYARVPTREDAEVVLQYHPGQEVLEIERTDKIVGVHANRTIRTNLPRIELTRLPFILDGIALFRYHLLRCKDDQEMLRDIGSSIVTDGEENVKMCLYHLGPPLVLPSKVERVIQGRKVTWKSAGNNVKREPNSETNLFEKNHAHLKSSEDERYGLKIENYTPHGFFPYLFYFDPSDYSIQQWFYPYPTRMPGPPLRALEDNQPGSIMVGYGMSGGKPIQFTSDDPKDTGFIKLFVSSVRVDMEHIAQNPVIQAERKRKALKKADDNKIYGGLLAGVTVSQSEPK